MGEHSKIKFVSEQAKRREDRRIAESRKLMMSGPKEPSKIESLQESGRAKERTQIDAERKSRSVVSSLGGWKPNTATGEGGGGGEGKDSAKIKKDLSNKLRGTSVEGGDSESGRSQQAKLGERKPALRTLAEGLEKGRDTEKKLITSQAESGFAKKGTSESVGPRVGVESGRAAEGQLSRDASGTAKVKSSLEVSPESQKSAGKAAEGEAGGKEQDKRATKESPKRTAMANAFTKGFSAEQAGIEIIPKGPKKGDDLSISGGELRKDMAKMKRHWAEQKDTEPDKETLKVQRDIEQKQSKLRARLSLTPSDFVMGEAPRDYKSPEGAWKNWVKEPSEDEAVDVAGLNKKLDELMKDPEVLKEASKNLQNAKEAAQTFQESAKELKKEIAENEKLQSGQEKPAEGGVEKTKAMDPQFGVFNTPDLKEAIKPLDKLKLPKSVKENLLLVTVGDGKALVTKAYRESATDVYVVGDPIVMRGPYHKPWTTGSNLPPGLYMADEKGGKFTRVEDNQSFPMGITGELSSDMQKRGEYGVGFGSKKALDHFRELVKDRPYVVWVPSEGQKMSRSDSGFYKVCEALGRAPEFMPAEAGRMLKDLLSVEGVATVLAGHFAYKYRNIAPVGQLNSVVTYLFLSKGAINAGAAVSMARDAETQVELDAAAAMFGRAFSTAMVGMGVGVFTNRVASTISRTANGIIRPGGEGNIMAKGWRSGLKVSLEAESLRKPGQDLPKDATEGWSGQKLGRVEEASSGSPERPAQGSATPPQSGVPVEGGGGLGGRGPARTLAPPIVTDGDALWYKKTGRKTAPLGDATPQQERAAALESGPHARAPPERPLHGTLAYGERGPAPALPHYGEELMARLGDNPQTCRYNASVFQRAGLTEDEVGVWIASLEQKAREFGINSQVMDRVIQSHISTEAALMQHIKNRFGMTWEQVGYERRGIVNGNRIDGMDKGPADTLFELEDLTRLERYWNQAKQQSPGIEGTDMGTRLYHSLGRRAEREARTYVNNLLERWSRGGVRHMERYNPERHVTP